MVNRRIQRINSLLKEVISEVIHKDLKNHKIPTLVSITEVDTSKDLRHAKVYVSLLEDDQERKEEIMSELELAAGYIAVLASKKVVIRYFPALSFKLDESIDHYMQIDSLLKKIENTRNPNE